MSNIPNEEYFACLKVSPAQMDHLWAEGWRHFGIYFFRYRRSVHDKKSFTVLPLRVNLEHFSLTRSQRRVLAKNRDAKIVCRPAATDGQKHTLFAKHSVRFRDNVPASLDDFLSPQPASMPCVARELCVYLDERLVGVTYLDLGKHATSAVYAIFDPTEAKRSLGILMMLHSLQLSCQRGCRYYYPGYAYREPFIYDYKKRFRGLEYLDWDSGWLKYPGQNPSGFELDQ